MTGIKQAGESLEMQNDCVEIKLRPERRIGEYSKKLPKAQGKCNDLTYVQGDKKLIPCLECVISYYDSI